MSRKPFNPLRYGIDLELARRRAGLSIRELGRAIGISHATACRVANGRPPNVENYLRINRWLEQQKSRVSK